MATIIYNNTIPFKGYQAITIWPLIFARNSAKWLKDYVENHEKIHLAQQLEVMLLSMAVIALTVCISGISWRWMLLSLAVYYVLYGLDYAIRYIAYGSHREAYRNICFEQEAYMNERDLQYLRGRRDFAWIKYIGKQTYRKI